MTGPIHRGNPGRKPAGAQKRESHRTITERAAVRNNMTVTDGRKYASPLGDRTHPPG